MRRRNLTPPAALLFAAAAAPATAQSDARARLLVDTEWLAAHIADPGIVLLHVGERPEYDAGHLPGAIHVTMRDLSEPMPAEHVAGMRMLELPDPAVARAKLESWGVSDDSRIIVYYGNDWVSPATRVLFTLDWLGIEDVALLDGGMQAWLAEGRAVVTDLPAPRPGRLTAKPTRAGVVSLEWMREQASQPGTAVVDARAAVFYEGVQSGSNGARGHIPGAGSFPFTEVTDDRLRIRPAEELRALFRNAGVEPGDRVVVYCHIGQQATAVAFAARTLGYDVRLFDGSMDAWGSAGLPTESNRR